MAIKTKSQIQTEISNLIISGGNLTTANNVRTVYGSILDSYPNIVDGGNVFQNTVGYTTDFAHSTGSYAFAHVKWVEDNFAPVGSVLTNGSGIDLTGNVLSLNSAYTRGLFSFAAGSGAYNSSTGVITIPTDNSQLLNGAGYVVGSIANTYIAFGSGTSIAGSNKLTFDGSNVGYMGARFISAAPTNSTYFSVGYNVLGNFNDPTLSTNIGAVAAGLNVFNALANTVQGIGFGYNVFNVATGSRNTGFGSNVFASVTTGTENTGVGNVVGQGITTGFGNIHIGEQLGATTNSLSNTLAMGMDFDVSESNIIQFGGVRQYSKFRLLGSDIPDGDFGSFTSYNLLVPSASGGTDKAGLVTYFDASGSTGTGVGGSLIFRTTPAGSTGASANTRRDSLAVTGNGLIGIGTASPTAYMDIAASTTSAASVRLRAGTAPTLPNDGDFWYASNAFAFRQNGTTIPIPTNNNQLNNGMGYRRTVAVHNTDSTKTGDINITVLANLAVTGGSMGANGSLFIETMTKKSGTAGTVTWRIYLSTVGTNAVGNTGTPTSSTLIATYTQAATNLTGGTMTRKLTNKNAENLNEIFSPTTSALSFNTAITTAISTIDFNTASPFWIVITAQLGSSSDTANMGGAQAYVDPMN
jgi:hypothetical protein